MSLWKPNFYYSLCKTTINSINIVDNIEFHFFTKNNVPGKLVFGFLMLKFKTGEITQLRPALYKYTFASFNLIKIISFFVSFFFFLRIHYNLMISRMGSRQGFIFPSDQLPKSLPFQTEYHSLSRVVPATLHSIFVNAHFTRFL